MKLKNLLLGLTFFTLLLFSNPLSVMGCVKGMVWGMDIKSIESHLGSKLDSMGMKGDSNLYEMRNMKISGLDINRLQLHIDDEMGLDHLAYEMHPEHMTEVLAGLRHRFGTPVTTSIHEDSSLSQQQWIWHTGEDIITALRSDEKPFLLSYRPSALDPSYL